jgi:hypothetical protein
MAASLLPYTLSLIWFQAVLLFQQNRKYKVVHILVYLPRFHTAGISDGKSDPVSGNNMDSFHVAV